MINEKVKKLFERAEKDEEFGKQFFEASSVADIKEVAASIDIELTETEINEAREDLKKSLDQEELSEKDLDNVAGGGAFRDQNISDWNKIKNNASFVAEGVYNEQKKNYNAVKTVVTWVSSW